MIVTIIAIYLSVGLLGVAPLASKYYYSKWRASYYDADGLPKYKKDKYGQKSVRRTEEEIDEKASEGLVFHAVLFGLVWPVSLYLNGVRYSGEYSRIKERQRVAEQRQQEKDLERAMEIVQRNRLEIASQRKQDELNFDSALTALEGTAGKLEKRKS